LFGCGVVSGLSLDRYDGSIALHMKLPALWILVAFAAGIGIAARWPGSPKVWIVAVALLVLAGVGFARGGFVATAWIRSLAPCLALGGLASGVERAGIPSNHIARLIAADSTDTSVALRWRGRLREDPMALP
jgi:hypothetical protein